MGGNEILRIVASINVVLGVLIIFGDVYLLSKGEVEIPARSRARRVFAYIISTIASCYILWGMRP